MSIILAQDSNGVKVVAVVTTGPQGPPGGVVGASGTGFLFYNSGVPTSPARAVNPTLATDFVVGGNNTVLTSNGTIGVWQTIVNANISNSAAIAASKLAAGTANTVLTTTGGVPTWAAIVDANISASAAIAVSKLAAGTNGFFLSTVAGVPTWVSAPGTTPGGSNTQMQYNNAGAFGGVANLTTDGSNVTKLQVSADPTWIKSANVGTLAWTPTTTRTLTLPDATDTVVARATTDTLTNKTINLSNNTVNDTSIATGDLAKSNGTKFVRFARGSANFVLCVNSGGTDLVYQQIVDANVASGAAIASSKLAAPGSTTQVIYNNAGAFAGASGVLTDGSTYVSIGTTPSTTGALRLPNNVSVSARDVTNAADYNLAKLDNSNYLTLGGSAYIQHLQGGNDFIVGGVSGQMIRIVSGFLNNSQPIIGDGAASPWGIHGMVSIAIGDANHTLTAAEYQYHFIKFTSSTQTATRTMTFPAPASDAAGYWKIVENAVTANIGTLVISTGVGSTVTIGAGNPNVQGKLLLWFDTRGVTKCSSYGSTTTSNTDKW